MASTEQRLRGSHFEDAEAFDSEPDLGELGPAVGGDERPGEQPYVVRSPYDGRPVAVVRRAGPADLEDAIDRTTRKFRETRTLPSWQRAQVLERVSAIGDEPAEAIWVVVGRKNDNRGPVM